jgi:hypothetical protein
LAEHSFRDGREAMDTAVEELSAGMVEVLEAVLALPAFTEVMNNRDVLFACSDVGLLLLPWAMLPLGGGRVIQLVSSFTVNPSLTAAALLTDCPAHRTVQSGPLDMAAYCAPAPRDNPGKLPSLDWQRLVNPAAWPSLPPGFVPLQDVLGGRLDLAGDLGSPQANLAAVLDYPAAGECRVLLVAGHGDPREGLCLLDGEKWAPHRPPHQRWKLQHTEAAILPACRLGEMFLEQGEVAGFVAGLLLQNIPRVLSCRWLAYDLPLCRLIPRLLQGVVARRRTAEQACWAGALREVIVEGLATGNHRLYDLANLLLIGVP